MVREAYTLRAADDDFGQAGTLVRQVLDEPARARLLSNIIAHLKDGVSEPILARAIDYWHKVDKAISVQPHRLTWIEREVDALTGA